MIEKKWPMPEGPMLLAFKRWVRDGVPSPWLAVFTDGTEVEVPPDVEIERVPDDGAWPHPAWKVTPPALIEGRFIHAVCPAGCKKVRVLSSVFTGEIPVIALPGEQAE